jgi:hypothetical protein
MPRQRGQQVPVDADRQLPAVDLDRCAAAGRGLGQ